MPKCLCGLDMYFMANSKIYLFYGCECGRILVRYEGSERWDWYSPVKGGAAVTDLEEKRLRHIAQLKVAQEILSTALEAALNCFPEDETNQARGELAHYCIGYLGVSFGLTSS